jgi:hypothetical protein
MLDWTFTTLFSPMETGILDLMYWIYLLPPTQQTVGSNGFTTTCFDSPDGHVGKILHIQRERGQQTNQRQVDSPKY